MSCKLYLRFGKNDENKLGDDTIWGALFVLEIVMLVCALGFLKNINGKYRRTFISPMTAKQFACDWWLACDEDSMRIDVFQFHPDLWSGIRAEVEYWVRFNYGRWRHEKPRWFDQRVQASIPMEFTEFYSELEEVDMSEVWTDDSYMSGGASSSSLTGSSRRKSTDLLADMAYLALSKRGNATPTTSLSLSLRRTAPTSPSSSSKTSVYVTDLTNSQRRQHQLFGALTETQRRTAGIIRKMTDAERQQQAKNVPGTTRGNNLKKKGVVPV